MLTTAMMTTFMEALAAATKVDEAAVEAAVAVLAMSSDYLFGASKLWME